MAGTARQRAEVDPDLAALMKDLAARGLGTPEPAEVGIAEARRRNVAYFSAIAGNAPDPSRAETIEVTGETGGSIPVRVVHPAATSADAPALLYLHGGGYAFGDLDTHDHVFKWLAEATGMVVFGAHYRRTPEHAYPAQIHDALAALSAIRGTDWAGRFGHDPDRVVLFGDSAGAHLCMGLMLTLRDRLVPQPSGAVLAYGMYARRFDTWSHQTYGDGSYGLSSFRMSWFWDQLLAGRGREPDPVAEPLLADPQGLPPLALYAAECDCLLDDTLDMVRRLEDARHPHAFHLFPGALHGFLHLPGVYAGARAAFQRIGDDLRRLGRSKP
ncbi:MAG: alpha/beta hydrolase [Beijerinckiaceae bacterium]